MHLFGFHKPYIVCMRIAVIVKVFYGNFIENISFAQLERKAHSFSF